MIDTDYIFMITQYCFVCVKLSITGESSTGSLSISTGLQKSCSYGGKLVVMVVFVETGIILDGRNEMILWGYVLLLNCAMSKLIVLLISVIKRESVGV